MPTELERLRSDVRMSQEYLIVFVAIIIWDTIATWPGEYRYLWKQSWTSLKGVFLVNRYWSIIAQIVTMSLILAEVPSGACEKIFWLEIFNSLSMMLLAGVLVCYRVYKTYDENRRILYFFVGLLVTQMLIMTGAASQYRAFAYPANLVDYLGAPGCNLGNTRINRRLVAALYWTPPLIFHAAAFAMVLYRDITMTRKAGKLTMAKRLADEGAFNLFVIVASLIPNIALFIQSNENLIYLNAPASLTLTSLMCSRMVLAQFNPATSNSLQVPTTAFRPSGNHPSNGTAEPYSITLNSTMQPNTPNTKPGNGSNRDLEGNRGNGEDEEELENDVVVASYTPVLGKDDRPATSSSSDGQEEEKDEKDEEKPNVGLGMSV